QRSSGIPPRRRRSFRPRQQLPASSLSPTDTTHRLLEGACIKALIVDPTLVHFINRAFREFELASLQPEDFSHTDFKETFKLVKQALDQDVENPVDYIQKRLPEPLRDFVLEGDQEESYPNWRFQPNAPILESLLNMFIRLRRIRIDEGFDQLGFLQSQEWDEEEQAALDINKIYSELIGARARLDQALRQGKRPS
ncbi:MAG: hypothetical protein SVP52_08200, partial [Chloroflexota bacterium]|nr:hypothetical protein [Chloroflexota bacterium]